jgi:hypothetical protein
VRPENIRGPQAYAQTIVVMPGIGAGDGWTLKHVASGFSRKDA